jgi:uncharacterized protein YukE
MKDFKDEMKEFKDEMKEFKDEMKEFKDEMKDFKDEMKEFKDEMKEFKDEMKDFKDDTNRTIDEMNRKWSELAIKMGTVAEDIVAPGIPYAIKKYFNLEVEDLMVRRRKKLPDGRVQEYDVIAVAGDYVFVVEVKTKFKTHHIEESVSIFQKFFDFFPEFKNKTLIGMIASFYLTEDLINLASRNRILAVRMGGSYLEILNADKCPIKTS